MVKTSSEEVSWRLDKFLTDVSFQEARRQVDSRLTRIAHLWLRTEGTWYKAVETKDYTEFDAAWDEFDDEMKALVKEYGEDKNERY